MAFLIRPGGPEGTPPADGPPEGVTVERGAYLADAVTNCAGCHSPRSMLDGSYTGPRFSGGSPMPLDDDPETVLVAANLTPDPRTCRIAAWSEEAFLARFRVGRLVPGSHMPWALYARMTDADLKAVRTYLMSLAPVENDTRPLVRPAGDRAASRAAGGE